MFRADIDAGHIKSPLDIADVWPSSYSANTNEILWAAKFAARMPWIACVVRLSSYECGMDQPTYSPVQQIVEQSGTLFFSFQDLDSTKPAGRKDSRRDDRALSRKISYRYPRGEESGSATRLSLACSRITSALGRVSTACGCARAQRGLLQ
jgi:predicted nucleotide-binding protein (sugar kinase/HSP70/actin superfamily)